MIHTLDSIVKEYMIETGESQTNKYARYYQSAVAGLREFNLNSAGVIKAVELPIKVNDTVDLPHDYIQYTTIGLTGSDGQIHALGRNDSLSMIPQSDNCGQPLPLAARGDDGVTPLVNGGLYQRDLITSYRNGEFMGRIFGVRGGINPFGQFRIDRENSLIILTDLNRHVNSGRKVNSNTIPIHTIVLEYIADINKVDKDFVIHPFMIEALKAWIYFKAVQRDRVQRGGTKDRARRDYYTEARWAKKRFTSATLKEWTAAFRSGNLAAPKW